MIAWSRKRHLKARVGEEWFWGLPASARCSLQLAQTRQVIDASFPNVRFREGTIQMRGDSCFHEPD